MAAGIAPLLALPLGEAEQREHRNHEQHCGDADDQRRTAPCRHSSHRQPNAVAAIGMARKRCSRSIQRPAWAACPEARGPTRRSGTAARVRGRAQRTPAPIRPRQQQRRAERRAEERSRAGRRDECRECAGRKAARRLARPPSTGSSNSPAKLAVMAVASSSRSMIVRGSWSWNAQPAALPPARISNSAAERAGADDRAGRISERVAPGARASHPRRATGAAP